MSYDKAAVIRRQIPRGVLMSLGARDFVGDAAEGMLQFRVGPSRDHFKVRIQLTPRDDYDVRLYKLECGGLEVAEPDHAEGVYCDELGELLLRWEGRHLVS